MVYRLACVTPALGTLGVAAQMGCWLLASGGASPRSLDPPPQVACSHARKDVRRAPHLTTPPETPQRLSKAGPARRDDAGQAAKLRIDSGSSRTGCSPSSSISSWTRTCDGGSPHTSTTRPRIGSSSPQGTRTRSPTLTCRCGLVTTDPFRTHYEYDPTRYDPVHAPCGPDQVASRGPRSPCRMYREHAGDRLAAGCREPERYEVQ